MVTGELVEYVGAGAAWASLVQCHPVVSLTDMFEDVATEAAGAARASVFDDSSDDDATSSGDSNEASSAATERQGVSGPEACTTQRDGVRVQERGDAMAARETWNKGRVSLSFAPRRSHRPPYLPAVVGPGMATSDNCRLGRWLVSVEGSQLYAVCEESEWRSLTGAGGARADRGGGACAGGVDTIPRDGYPHPAEFLRLKSAAVCRVRPGGRP